MKVLLIDANEAMVRCWKRWLRNITTVECHSGTLDTVKAEPSSRFALVLPGNSFGFLGGGFDLAACKYFGRSTQLTQFEEYFRAQLNYEYKSPGSATLLSLGPWSKNRFEYIIHVPTIVAPTSVSYDPLRPIETGYRLVFDTTWNALAAIPEQVSTVVFPGMCTGYVGVPHEISAKSMAFAIRLFLSKKQISENLCNALIMYFLGYGFPPFFDHECAMECQRHGIDSDILKDFDVSQDSIDMILPK